MPKSALVGGLVLLVLLFSACGSKAEGDLDKSEADLQKQAKAMDKAELQQRIEDLKSIAQDVQSDAKSMGPEALMSDKGKDLRDRAEKVAKVLMVYQLELANRK